MLRARRPQQTRGFLAERVEQLLLVERARRPKLLLEVIEGLPELLLAFACRGQLFGDAPEERADFRFRVSAKRAPERPVGDVFRGEVWRTADDPLPPVTLRHPEPPKADARALRPSSIVVSERPASARPSTAAALLSA